MLRLANKLLDSTLAIVEQTEARLHAKARKGEAAPTELQFVRTQLLQLGYLISVPGDFFYEIDGLFDDRANSAIETFLSSPTHESAGSKRESNKKRGRAMSGSLATAAQTERSAPAGGSTAEPLIPDEMNSLFDQRPLIKGEQAEDYEQLLAGLIAEVDPKGMTEWVWVKDLADNIWESLRLRRIKATSITIGMQRAGRKLLVSLMPPEEGNEFERATKAEKLVLDYLGGDADATKTLVTVLKRGDLTLDALSAMSVSDNLEALERLDRMGASLERRRMSILREVEMRRAILAERMRNASKKYVDNVTDISPAA